MYRYFLAFFVLLFSVSLFSQDDPPSVNINKSLIQLSRNGKMFFLAPGTSGQYLTTNGTTLSFGAPAASSISIVDAGGFFTATEIEAALQEIAGWDAGDIAIVDLSGHYGTSSTEGALQEIGDRHLTGSSDINFASAPAGTSLSFDIPVTGAAVGDPVKVGHSVSNANCSFEARVLTADTVTVFFHNYSSAAINPGLSNFSVEVSKW